MVEFQCAVASHRRDEPIFATASQVHRWLLVEVRGAWGRDAVADTELGHHVTDEWRTAMRAAGVRVVAIRRDLDRSTARSLRLFYAETTVAPGPSGLWTNQVAGLHSVLDATSELPGRAPAGGWSAHAEAVILVCTNGRHDSCCATFGRPVVRELRTSEHADAVWECSHIGGDRFAGNIVVLPDGLYFGRCNAATAVAVVDRYRRGHLHLEHYRGCSARGFAHQAAEHFTRRRLGITAVDGVAALVKVGDPADGRFHVDVDALGTVEVVVRRRVGPAPSALTCTGPADVTLPRFELTGFRVLPAP